MWALTSDQWVTFASSLVGALVGGLATIAAAYVAARSAFGQYRSAREHEALWEVATAGGRLAGLLAVQAQFGRDGEAQRGEVTDELRSAGDEVTTIMARVSLLPAEFRDAYAEAVSLVGPMILDIELDAEDDPPFVDPAMAIAMRLQYLERQAHRSFTGESVSIDSWSAAPALRSYDERVSQKLAERWTRRPR